MVSVLFSSIKKSFLANWLLQYVKYAKILVLVLIIKKTTKIFAICWLFLINEDWTYTVFHKSIPPYFFAENQSNHKKWIQSMILKNLWILNNEFGCSKKSQVFKSINSEHFSRNGPWVNRINSCIGQGCSFTYMGTRLSNKVILVHILFMVRLTLPEEISITREVHGLLGYRL